MHIEELWAESNEDFKGKKVLLCVDFASFNLSLCVGTVERKNKLSLSSNYLLWGTFVCTVDNYGSFCRSLFFQFLYFVYSLALENVLLSLQLSVSVGTSFCFSILSFIFLRCLLRLTLYLTLQLVVNGNSQQRKIGNGRNNSKCLHCSFFNKSSHYYCQSLDGSASYF